MKIKMHSALAAVALFFAAAVAPDHALAVNCSKNPTHPNCTGGDGGNPDDNNCR